MKCTQICCVNTTKSKILYLNVCLTHTRNTGCVNFHKGVANVAKKNKKKKRKSSNALNRHHILWQQRHWNYGYAKIIRNHEYLVVPIPANTLHREIHEYVGDIPVPKVRHIKEALDEINRLLKLGAISLDDPLLNRIDLLIFMWDYVEPDTVTALKKQRKVVARFYERQA